MSPLIDLTNTVAPDLTKNVHFSSPKNCSFGSEPKNVENTNCSSVEGSELTKEVSPLTKCNTTKPSKPIRKRRSFKKLTQCDPKMVSSAVKISTEPNCRVPPLPSEQLSEALQSLHLSVEKYGEGNLVSSVENGLGRERKTCDSKSTGGSNSGAPCSAKFGATYQCIACGLELSSIDNLTNHLVKHIYEGLHAASWLNNAMSTLLFPFSSSHDNSEANLSQADLTPRPEHPSPASNQADLPSQSDTLPVNKSETDS